MAARASRALMCRWHTALSEVRAHLRSDSARELMETGVAPYVIRTEAFGLQSCSTRARIIREGGKAQPASYVLGIHV